MRRTAIKIKVHWNNSCWNEQWTCPIFSFILIVFNGVISLKEFSRGTKYCSCWRWAEVTVSLCRTTPQPVHSDVLLRAPHSASRACAPATRGRARRCGLPRQQWSPRSVCWRPPVWPHHAPWRGTTHDCKYFLVCKYFWQKISIIFPKVYITLIVSPKVKCCYKFL